MTPVSEFQQTHAARREVCMGSEARGMFMQEKLWFTWKVTWTRRVASPAITPVSSLPYSSAREHSEGRNNHTPTHPHTLHAPGHGVQGVCEKA
ncbi:hypothetical protein E2C01_018828 [Portunus trituberculatus]|uniref:Uncharacterized protein n=1 Tax=Portunus trituberculatus TaxID=210409 RepID=A0A5B7DXJ4_PORTR|nr:hypothetical protein [Portunus trituberculatus]